MNPKYDLADPQQIVDAAIEVGSLSELARQTGINRRTLQSRVNRAGLSVPVQTPQPLAYLPAAPEATPAELLDARRRLERAVTERNQLKALLKQATANANLLDDIRDLITPSLQAAPIKPAKPAVVAQRKRTKTGVSIVVHLTDLHWGEIVDPEQVGGLNAYSPEIAALRIQHIIDTIAKWVRNYDKLTGVEEIVFIVNGDTVSGQHNLHPDSADEYARIAVQVRDAAMVVAQAVSEVAPLVKRVRIFGTQGNHPRGTRKPPTGKAHTETSWETLFHELTAALLIRHRNVDYHVARSYRITTQIGPSTWAIMHGHMMKGGGGSLGIPAYGLKRVHDATRDRSITTAHLTELADSMRNVVKHTRIGHFHLFTKWGVGEGTVGICPSPKGVDNFVTDALERYSPAAVLIEVVHPEHDIIADHLVSVQHIMSDVTPSRYIWGVTGSKSAAATLDTLEHA